jgi:hypothetical protein
MRGHLSLQLFEILRSLPPIRFFQIVVNHKGSVLPLPHRNTVQKEKSILSTLPEEPRPCAKLVDKSNELIIPVTSDLFDHRSDIVFIEDRPRTITSGHVLEPFAHFANI